MRVYTQLISQQPTIQHFHTATKSHLYHEADTLLLMRIIVATLTKHVRRSADHAKSNSNRVSTSRGTHHQQNTSRRLANAAMKSAIVYPYGAMRAGCCRSMNVKHLALASGIYSMVRKTDRDGYRERALYYVALRVRGSRPAVKRK